MKQMFDKRELALSSTSDEGLRIKTYGFKDLRKLLVANQFDVDESLDVLNLRLLEEEKGEITSISINLKNKSTIVNLYVSGNLGNIELYYQDNLSIYHNHYILNGIDSSSTIISVSPFNGFRVSFDMIELATSPYNNSLIRINPKIIKFKDYDSYLYDVSFYTQQEI